MKCECCQKAEATIHLTQVLDGEVKKLNLCQTCAQENGIDLNSPISITDVLLGLGNQQGTEQSKESPAEFDLSCGRCQMTRAEFKKRARLGCPDCYQAFMGELSALTQAMHHSRQHVGKIPARQGNEARFSAQIAALQKDIETAIAKEEYETAAALRDKIRTLKEQVPSSESGGPNDA
ncbi:MAG: excinuclease ABC subunit B [Kiritimatiellales bacterium]|nr:UvrB/UvrC motif-containing protein [Pontiella sp.]NNJ69707.1 excinuclease ABC subunit B [Kiritimatiellales bacterium]